MVLLSSLICFLYGGIILYINSGFKQKNEFHSEFETPKHHFSIVIPFRNESENLEPLLESLQKMKYPKDHYEIIFVDDFSEDDSVAILENFIREKSDLPIHIIESLKTSKKQALYSGISHATYDWIVTTDADCCIPENWLLNFDTFLQNKNSHFIAGPVSYSVNTTFFENFQNLDFLSLIGTTIGTFGLKKPFLCNGANLCFDKKVFFELGGYLGNETIASGDDVFLLEKFQKKHPDKVHFIQSQNSIVTTNPEKTIGKLISQRIRWAAKTTAYKSGFAKFTGLLVLLMNLCFVFAFLYSFKNPISFGIVCIVKFPIDYLLIRKTALFLDQKKSLQFYFLSAFLYPFFSIYIAISSLYTGYHWKGRTNKK